MNSKSIVVGIRVPRMHVSLCSMAHFPFSEVFFCFEYVNLDEKQRMERALDKKRNDSTSYFQQERPMTGGLFSCQRGGVYSTLSLQLIPVGSNIANLHKTSVFCLKYPSPVLGFESLIVTRLVRQDYGQRSEVGFY